MRTLAKWLAALRIPTLLISVVFLAATGGCQSTANGGMEAVDLARFDLTNQPIHDYNMPYQDNAFPMRFYSRLGTNYGPMPDWHDKAMRWERPGHVVVDLKNWDWVGAWHSLSGLTRLKQPGDWLDFSAPYSNLIEPAFQPRIVGLYIRAKGQGRLKLELKSRDEKGYEIEYPPFRLKKIELNDPREMRTYVWLWQKEKSEDRLINVGQLADAHPGHASWPKSMFTFKNERIAMASWVAEGWGTKATVDDFGFIVAFPKMSPTQRMYVKSLAKLLRCYDPEVGLVGDRANFPARDMCNVQATGCLTLAVAAGSTVGVVSRAKAERFLRDTHGAFQSLPRAHGLMPRFARYVDGKFVTFDAGLKSNDGRWIRFPFSDEYSSVDSAIAFHGRLLAAEILGDTKVREEIAAEIRRIEVSELLKEIPFTDRNGQHRTGRFIRMRFDAHGKIDPNTDPAWVHWGGEGVLIICLASAAGYDKPVDMNFPNGDPDLNLEGKDGSVFEGRGFIGELQSLFYPHFDSHQRDALTLVDWRQSRIDLYRDQLACTQRFAGTKAARLGFYGYSSGEARQGQGYIENGTRRYDHGERRPIPTQPLIFPHYMMMSACVPEDSSVPLKALVKLEEHGLFPPWGMVENFDADLGTSLALMGALNASFESISAYHLMCKVEGRRDAIYEAARKSPVLAPGIRKFYVEQRD